MPILSKEGNHSKSPLLIMSNKMNKIKQQRCNSTITMIYKRLPVLQNPKNCATARKLICGSWPSGMEPVWHHWIDYFIYAYHTNRTMLIDARKWSDSYLKSKKVKDGVEKFEDLFLPISKCQYNRNNRNNEVKWSKSINKDLNSTVLTLGLDHIFAIYENFNVMPAISIYLCLVISLIALLILSMSW